MQHASQIVRTAATMVVWVAGGYVRVAVVVVVVAMVAMDVVAVVAATMVALAAVERAPPVALDVAAAVDVIMDVALPALASALVVMVARLAEGVLPDVTHHVTLRVLGLAQVPALVALETVLVSVLVALGALRAADVIQRVILAVTAHVLDHVLDHALAVTGLVATSAPAAMDAHLVAAVQQLVIWGAMQLVSYTRYAKVGCE